MPDLIRLNPLTSEDRAEITRQELFRKESGNQGKGIYFV
jgi:hypothetical protein